MSHLDYEINKDFSNKLLEKYGLWTKLTRFQDLVFAICQTITKLQKIIIVLFVL
jgi:hypothetical protein